MLPVFGLSLLFSVGLCVHAVRTGQPIYWLFIILMLQPLGGIVYLAAVIAPELIRGPTARRIGKSARETIDPGREYRQAKSDCQQSPSVNNQIRLAKAAAALGRHEEAEALYAKAAQGIHADDPVLLLGRATGLTELDRFAEALSLMDHLGLEERGRTPAAALTLARVYEGLGRMQEAETAYQWAAGRLPGLEGLARYAAFLAHVGRPAEAREIVTEMDTHVAKANPRFRKEARAWRDMAARTLSGREAGQAWP
jgi:hypothetical protein